MGKMLKAIEEDIKDLEVLKRYLEKKGTAQFKKKVKRLDRQIANLEKKRTENVH